MFDITFRVYSNFLKKTFEHKMRFNSMTDYRLHCYALYSYLPTPIKIEEVTVAK